MNARRTRFLFVALVLVSMASCGPPEAASGVRWAGFRASPYGIQPFPDADEWGRAATAMEGRYPGSTGTFVWIAGTVNGSAGNQTCMLNFPLDDPVAGAVDFPFDENEAFLRLADQRGYAVWLQVEPGDADLPALAEGVMRRYRSHPSVKGFGVDVEWYRTQGTGGFGTKVSDALARTLVERVQGAKPGSTCFLKHWDPAWMPPTAREGLVFVNDSQGHPSLEAMRAEFQDWATTFAPRPVLFQIGYEADRPLWQTLPDPVRDLGGYLTAGLPTGQEVGIVWVDFTLRSVLGETLSPRP